MFWGKCLSCLGLGEVGELQYDTMLLSDAAHDVERAAEELVSDREQVRIKMAWGELRVGGTQTCRGICVQIVAVLIVKKLRPPGRGRAATPRVGSSAQESTGTTAHGGAG